MGPTVEQVKVITVEAAQIFPVLAHGVRCGSALVLAL